MRVISKDYSFTAASSRRQWVNSYQRRFPIITPVWYALLRPSFWSAWDGVYLLFVNASQTYSSPLLISLQYHIHGLVQERRNSIANAMELRLSHTKPLTWYWMQHDKGNVASKIWLWLTKRIPYFTIIGNVCSVSCVTVFWRIYHVKTQHSVKISVNLTR